jgi:hypothetical protein
VAALLVAGGLMLGRAAAQEPGSPSAAPAKAGAVERDWAALSAWLDERFAAVWTEAGLDPTAVDDATFLRRVYLDLVGRIPSVAEAREFRAASGSHKRQALVDKLLIDQHARQRNSQEFAEHFARLWRRMMLPPTSETAAQGVAFEPWLTEQFRDNVAYDELARRLLTADGETSGGVAPYYQAVGGTPESYATAFTRVFLGARMGCAQCHNHPFASWKQQDFWGLAAFFAGLSPAQPAVPPFVGGQLTESRVTTISYEGVEYHAQVPWNGPLDIGPTARPRVALADWMTAPANTHFTETAVNRVWQHLCGRGLVSAVDDLDLAQPEERELVLAELGRRFAENGHDLRWLIQGICNSRAYQCDSLGDAAEEASLLTGRRPLKTLTSEQVFDSLEQALLLPVTRSNVDSARHNGQRMQMVARLDESLSATPEEYGAGIPQVLMLMNGLLMAQGTSFERSRTLKGVVEAPFMDEPARLDTLFLAALTRLPTDKEREVLQQHLAAQESQADRRNAYADIFWALLNSPEFVLCR